MVSFWFTGLRPTSKNLMRLLIAVMARPKDLPRRLNIQPATESHGSSAQLVNSFQGTSTSSAFLSRSQNEMKTCGKRLWVECHTKSFTIKNNHMGLFREVICNVFAPYSEITVIWESSIWCPGNLTTDESAETTSVDARWPSRFWLVRLVAMAFD